MFGSHKSSGGEFQTVGVATGKLGCISLPAAPLTPPLGWRVDEADV